MKVVINEKGAFIATEDGDRFGPFDPVRFVLKLEQARLAHYATKASQEFELVPAKQRGEPSTPSAA